MVGVSHADRHIPWRLEARLVEARERAPRINRREYGKGVPSALDFSAEGAGDGLVAH